VAGHANDAITVVTPNTEQLNSSLTLGFINCALKLSKENILGLLGSKYYQIEERSEANPLVYGRKRENQRYQSYQGSNVV
jgi:hypothetical protein